MRNLSCLLLTCISSANLIVVDGKAQLDQSNILVIITDEFAWNAMNCAGNDQVYTPNLDQFVTQSIYFKNAVTACPVCAPARTSMFTGRTIEKTHIRLNADISRNDCNYPSYDEILTKSGYRAEYYGKYHAPSKFVNAYRNPSESDSLRADEIINWEKYYKKFLKENINPRELQEGELYEKSFYGGTIPYKLNPLDKLYEELNASDWVDFSKNQIIDSQEDVHGVLDIDPEMTITAYQAKQTIEALQRIKQEKFILTCSFHCPHVPITPSDPYASMYNTKDISPSPSVSSNMENSPYKSYLDHTPDKYSNAELVKYMMADYYAFISELDYWIGKILEELDREGLSENTYVIFVSDHGEMLGAHGLRGKFCFYEESVRVPLIIRFPGNINAGKEIHTPVSTLNLFSTILDFANIQNIPSDGYSLNTLIKGEKPEFPFAFSEWSFSRETVPTIMIRTEKWKLMTSSQMNTKSIDGLFDLEFDPFEMDNLIFNKSEKIPVNRVIKELNQSLINYMKSIDYPFLYDFQVKNK